MTVTVDKPPLCEGTKRDTRALCAETKLGGRSSLPCGNTLEPRQLQLQVR